MREHIVAVKVRVMDDKETVEEVAVRVAETLIHYGPFDAATVMGGNRTIMRREVPDDLWGPVP
jgi:predicted neutral ceramidase superfamily lipid hydrolase